MSVHNKLFTAGTDGLAAGLADEKTEHIQRDVCEKVACKPCKSCIHFAASTSTAADKVLRTRRISVPYALCSGQKAEQAIIKPSRPNERLLKEMCWY